MSDRILPPWPKEHSQSCFDIRSQRCVCTIENESQRCRMAGPWAVDLLKEIADGMCDGHQHARIMQFLAELREGIA